MVLISDSKKYIFIHIPKTGGQTIKETLNKQDKNVTNLVKKKLKYNINNYFYLSNEYHFTYNELKIYNQKTYNNYFKFIFVRNPYDRLYSCIQYIKYNSNIIKIKYIIFILYTYLIYLLILKKRYLFLIIIIFFKIYIMIIDFEFKDFNYIIKNHFHFIYKYFPYTLKPQYEYIKNTNINFIGRIENFNNDFKFILKKFNYNSDIKNTNITGNINNNNNNNNNKSIYIDKFNKETINLVNTIYDKDFKEFNYKKIL